MRESTMVLVQYATGALALFLVGAHLAMHGVVVPYETSLEFQRIISLYKSPLTASMLGLLLVTALAHGLNGVRIILLEWRQGEKWEKVVNWGAAALGAVLLAIGAKNFVIIPLLVP